MDSERLSALYRIVPLKERRAEHSRDDKYLEKAWPEVHLCSRNKIKFKIYKRVHEKYLKSPIFRGTLMWDRIPESIQRSTTKVKFKRDLKPYMADLIMPLLK